MNFLLNSRLCKTDLKSRRGSPVDEKKLIGGLEREQADLTLSAKCGMKLVVTESIQSVLV